jgi:hypothetical protein
VELKQCEDEEFEKGANQAFIWKDKRAKSSQNMLGIAADAGDKLSCNWS